MEHPTQDRAAPPVMRVQGLHLRHVGVGDAPDYHLSVPDFEIAHGARVGLIGDSGSGKTSFLELLGLLAWPDEIARFDFAPLIDEAVIDLCPTLRARNSSLLSQLRARCIGFVLQDGGLLPYLTVRGNAEMARQLSGQAPDRAVIVALAEAMGIAPYLDRYQSALSGGQRQRAAVLRALAQGVPLLLADEPTAALDPASSAAVLEAMVRSADAIGATIIVASHNAPLLADFGFQILRVEVSEAPGLRTATLVPQ